MSAAAPRLFLRALPAAAAAHLALALAVFWQPPPPGATGSGTGGMEIGVGLAGGVPGRAGAPAPQPAALAAPPRAKASPAPMAPTTPVRSAMRTVAASTPPRSTPVSPPSEATVATATRPSRAKPTETVPSDPHAAADARHRGAPRTAPAPSPRPDSPVRQGRHLARTKTQAPRSAETAETAEPQASTRTAARQTRAVGAGGDSDSGEADSRAGTAGAGQSAALGGNPGARRDYMQRVAAQLARAKRYPRHARTRGQEGVGHLVFTIDAAGRVVDHRLGQGTGHDMLDRAILDMLARAAPFPAFPGDFREATLTLTVPVRFSLE